MYSFKSDRHDLPRFPSIVRPLETRQRAFRGNETGLQKVALDQELRRYVSSLLRLIAGIPPASDPDECPGEAARVIWDATSRMASLTARQRQVLTCIV